MSNSPAPFDLSVITLILSKASGLQRSKEITMSELIGANSKRVEIYPRHVKAMTESGLINSKKTKGKDGLSLSITGITSKGQELANLLQNKEVYQEIEQSFGNEMHSVRFEDLISQGSKLLEGILEKRETSNKQKIQSDGSGLKGDKTLTNTEVRERKSRYDLRVEVIEKAKALINEYGGPMFELWVTKKLKQLHVRSKPSMSYLVTEIVKQKSISKRIGQGLLTSDFGNSQDAEHQVHRVDFQEILY